MPQQYAGSAASTNGEKSVVSFVSFFYQPFIGERNLYTSTVHDYTGWLLFLICSRRFTKNTWLFNSSHLTQASIRGVRVHRPHFLAAIGIGNLLFIFVFWHLAISSETLLKSLVSSGLSCSQNGMSRINSSICIWLQPDHLCTHKLVILIAMSPATSNNELSPATSLSY